MSRLCVALPGIGHVSETFVRRHVQDVMPGETCVVALERIANPSWDIDRPTLLLREGNSFARRAKRSLSYRLNPSTPTKTREKWDYDAGDARRLVAFLKDQGAEAIMVEFADFLLPYIRPVRDAGIRWYSFGHGYDISQILAQPWWVERYRLLSGANGLFVRAESIRQRMIDTVGLSPDLVKVVRGGIDVPPTMPAPRAPGETVELLAVGRMVPKKAPLILLDSFRRALAHAPALRLHYIGGGPLLEAAQAYVAQHGLQYAVQLHGAMPPSFVAEKLLTTDIFVQHSIKDPETGDEEGLPAAITEAMGLAIPVVSTIHAGIPEAVRDGVNGFVVAEGDAEAMANRMVRLANDASLRRIQGEAGYALAKELFTWEGEKGRLIDLMELGKR